MSPLYSHRQIAWPTVIGAGVGSIVLVAGALVAQLGAALPLALAVIPAVVLLSFGSLTVRVYQDHIRVQFGIGAPRFTIDMRDVRSYRVVRNPWFYGWGIRLVPGGVMYNASGFDAVELRLDGGRVVRIGTDEPQALAAALAQVLPEDGFIRHAEPGAAVQPWLALVIPILFFAVGMIVATSVTCGRAQAAGQGAASLASATVRGVVQVRNGGGTLPGVTIDVAGAGVTRRVATNQDGSFEVRDLPAGRYRVTAALASFEPWSRDDVDVENGKTTELTVSLRPGISTDPGLAVLLPIDVVVRSADAILHIKIVSTLEASITGEDWRYPQTEHRAMVLDVIADRDRLSRAGSEVRLLQRYAGTAMYNGRAYTGGVPAHRPGDELVVLAERTGDALVVMSAPVYEFKIENGVIRLRQPTRRRNSGFADVMTVDGFADAARALIATTGPLRFGPTAVHLRAWAIWELHMVLGDTPRPWFFNASDHNWIREPKWYVEAHLEPDRLAGRLRVGQTELLAATLKPVGAYDGVRRWSREPSGRWAQVLVADGDDPLAFKDSRDIRRPFRVFGDIADGDLVSLVDFIRSSPENSGRQSPTATAIINRVEGQWPIRRLVIGDGAFNVDLLGLSRDETSGQTVVIRRIGARWTVTRIRAWTAD